MPYGNEPKREPDIKSQGKAWKITATDPNENGGVGADWLVYDGTHAHPFWWWYRVSCVHLRPLPEKGQAHLQFPGATHEVLFLALNPDHPLPDPDAWGPMHYLEPFDLVHQFVVNSDEDARDVIRLVVRHICAGHSPDTDFRSYWKRVIDKTAEHFRTGHGSRDELIT